MTTVTPVIIPVRGSNNTCQFSERVLQIEICKTKSNTQEKYTCLTTLQKDWQLEDEKSSMRDVSFCVLIALVVCLIIVLIWKKL